MKLPSIAVAVPIALASAPTLAGEFYILGAAGQSAFKLDQDKFDNVLTRAGAFGVTSTTHTDDTAYKLQFGYQFNPNFAVEAGYVDLGKATYDAAFFGGTARASIKAHGVNVAVVGSLPIAEGFSVFAKLGAINAKAETSLHTTGINASISSTNLRLNDGIGVYYELGKGFGARLEYEQFHKLGNSDAGTRRVEMWSLGLVVKF